MRFGKRLGRAGAAALVISLTAVTPVRAADFTVSNLNDSGPGSLRQALMDATTSSEPDRVLFAPGLTGTLTLTSGELQVPGGVDVIGPGAKQLTISGGGQSRIFHAANADPPVTFSGLTLANGMSTPGGGAIASQGTVTLSGMVLRDNKAMGAGGAFAHFNGPATVRDSTISGNSTAGASTPGGGGISVNAGALRIERSTITGNTATASTGGGVSQNTTGSEPLEIVDSTIAGNSSDMSGGGIFFTSVTRLTNTILADNSAPSRPDIDGMSASPDVQAKFSLIEQLGGAPVTLDATDLTGVDPKLASLADNGGPTPTQALVAGSPAIDKGSASGVDQRGLSRPFDINGIASGPGGNSADIGAYERVLCGNVAVNLIGTAGPDRISGTTGPDGILGLGGKDKLKGLKGNDGLCGGPGKDTLKGGPGKDTLLGQGGADTLIGGKGKDKLKGGPGKDKVQQ